MTDKERIKELEEHFAAYVELVANAENQRAQAVEELAALKAKLRELAK